MSQELTGKIMAKFMKGQSGNPAGRTPIAAGGKPNDVHGNRALINGHVPEIIEALAKEAKRGDIGAANTLMRYAMPTMQALAVETNQNQLPVMKIITSAMVEEIKEENEKDKRLMREAMKKAIKASKESVQSGPGDKVDE